MRLLSKKQAHAKKEYFLRVTFRGTRKVSHKKIKKQQAELIKQKNATAISTNFLLKSKQEILKIFFNKLSLKYDVQIKNDFLLVNEKMLRPIYTSKKLLIKM